VPVTGRDEVRQERLAAVDDAEQVDAEDAVVDLELGLVLIIFV
jgi:hypothetical protein